MPLNILIHDETEHSLTINRLPLRGWTELERQKREMDDAISKKDFDKYFISAVQFIEIASLHENQINWENVYWMEIMIALQLSLKENSPTIKFPFLTSEVKESKKLPWEYDERSWYFWLNIFAKIYGWSEQIIAELDIDTALGLYQEILIDEQLEQEWEWGLTEIAYPYNSSTKKSEFKPLERPSWMKPLIPKELPKIKIHRDMVPVGNVVRSENEKT